MGKMRYFYKSIDKYLVIMVLCAIAQICIYTLTGRMTTPATVMHSALDDRIPFVPMFILVYVSWFIFLFVGFVTLWHTHKIDAANHSAYIQSVSAIGISLLICGIIFAVFPTQIPPFYRETLAADNSPFRVFSHMVSSSDALRDAFPSEHCLTSILLAWALGRTPVIKKHRLRVLITVLAWVWALLICASTVLVKQHSIIDFYGAVALGAIVIAATELIARVKRKKQSQALKTVK